MTDGAPKDYSSMYSEQPIAMARSTAKLDGCFVPRRHKEDGIDLRQVVAKLEALPNRNVYAMDTLAKHYSSVFAVGYKVYIQYYTEKETYVVRVGRNTLQEVKKKLPKRGNYRLFFKTQSNSYEELEHDDNIVPYIEKDGAKNIYCQAFT